MDLREQAVGDALVDERMEDRFLFPFLPGSQDFFAGVGLEENRSACLNFEVIGTDLLAVDERQSESICENGAEFFHQIKGKGEAAGAGLVEETGLGIEANGFAGRAAIVGEEDVEKGKQGVGAVERWALAAAV